MPEITWNPIGNGEHVFSGQGEIAFKRSDNGGNYTVRFAESDQLRVRIVTDVAKLAMDIFIKEKSSDGTVAVSGIIADPDYTFGIEGSAWGQLIFSSSPSFRLYGNAVLLRSDIAEVTT